MDWFLYDNGHLFGPQSIRNIWQCFPPSLCLSKQHAPCFTFTFLESESNNTATQSLKRFQVGNISRLTWFHVIMCVWWAILCTRKLCVINHSAHKLQLYLKYFVLHKMKNNIYIYISMQWCSNTNNVVHCYCNLAFDLNIGSTSWQMKFPNIENFQDSFFICLVTDWQMFEFALLHR